MKQAQFEKTTSMNNLLDLPHLPFQKIYWKLDPRSRQSLKVATMRRDVNETLYDLKLNALHQRKLTNDDVKSLYQQSIDIWRAGLENEQQYLSFLNVMSKLEEKLNMADYLKLQSEECVHQEVYWQCRRERTFDVKIYHQDVNVVVYMKPQYLMANAVCTEHRNGCHKVIFQAIVKKEEEDAGKIINNDLAHFRTFISCLSRFNGVIRVEDFERCETIIPFIFIFDSLAAVQEEDDRPRHGMQFKKSEGEVNLAAGTDVRRLVIINANPDLERLVRQEILQIEENE